MKPILVIAILVIAMVWPSPVKNGDSNKHKQEAQRVYNPAPGRFLGELPKHDVAQSKESHLPLPSADEIERIIKQFRGE